MSTWYDVELVFLLLDSQSELQCNSGGLESLLKESMLLRKRVYMESVVSI
jgi:hypothetical protein